MSMTNLEQISSMILSERYYRKEEFPKDKTVHELFLEQVHRTPDHVALVYQEQSMTYQELNDKAEALAEVLVEKGVVEDKIVSILIEQSIDLMVSILGVLKAGGAFLVIDASYPASRIEFMMDNSDSDILITDELHKDMIEFQGDVLVIDDTLLSGGAKKQLNVKVGPESLLYLLYTSGSTGNPKALMEKHVNVVNVVNCLHHEIGCGSSNKMLQFFSPSFTVSYQEMFTALLYGATLYIADKERRNNVGKLFQYIKENEISTIFFPTAYLKTISKEPRFYRKLDACIDHIVTAGEKLIITEGFLEHLKRNNIKIYNNYGISEVNMSTLYEIPYDESRMDNLPIGVPIYNTYVYVLNEELEPLPVGCKGELYVSGEGVCRGYYKNELMTNQRFMKNPFHGGMMYKSGDIGMWDESGVLLVDGRADFQASIRGYRVETGEIEYILLNHPKVKEAAVVTKHLGDLDELYGYYISEEEITQEELEEYLASKLPSYMVPSYIYRLSVMPKLPAGKIDRTLLMKGNIEQYIIK